jgi:hypothetical protein
VATDQPIEPDTKDWTWVLEQPCPECGFEPSAVDVTNLADLIHQNTRGWFGALDGADASVRPDPQTWSKLEYACHVRDVHRIFGERAKLMLDVDDPQFANWDQDVTAIEDRYGEQDPAVVSVELVEAAADAAAVFAQVGDDQWDRPGRRSNGSVFTVATLGAYYLHDIAHHLHDIGSAAS